MTRTKKTQSLTGVATVILVLCSVPVAAQPGPTDGAPTLRTAAGSGIALQSDADLSSFTKAEWKALSLQQIDALQSMNDNVWPLALQNIVYVATHFPQQADFSGACPWLLETFSRSPRQRDRMAALAALYAIGDPGAMMYLAERVDEERNPAVKRSVIAALTEYYGLNGAKPSVKVGWPVLAERAP